MRPKFLENASAKKREVVQRFHHLRPDLPGLNRSKFCDKIWAKAKDPIMARKRYTPEEIIQRLRTAEIEQSKGLSQEEAARKIGVTPVTLSRWKAEYGGMRVDQAKRLKELEQENYLAPVCRTRG